MTTSALATRIEHGITITQRAWLVVLLPFWLFGALVAGAIAGAFVVGEVALDEWIDEWRKA